MSLILLPPAGNWDQRRFACFSYLKKQKHTKQNIVWSFFFFVCVTHREWSKSYFSFSTCKTYIFSRFHRISSSNENRKMHTHTHITRETLRSENTVSPPHTGEWGWMPTNVPTHTNTAILIVSTLTDTPYVQITTSNTYWLRTNGSCWMLTLKIITNNSNNYSCFEGRTLNFGHFLIWNISNSRAVVAVEFSTSHFRPN